MSNRIARILLGIWFVACWWTVSCLYSWGPPMKFSMDKPISFESTMALLFGPFACFTENSIRTHFPSNLIVLIYCLIPLLPGYFGLKYFSRFWGKALCAVAIFLWFFMGLIGLDIIGAMNV